MIVQLDRGVPKRFLDRTWSKIIDTLVGSSVAQGDLLVRGASGWQRFAAGTSGQILSSDGTDPLWASVASLTGQSYGIYKTSDETRNSNTTLTDDSTLLATLLANHRYRLVFDVYFSSGATPDFKYDFNFTGTTDSVITRALTMTMTTANLPAGESQTSQTHRGESALNLSRAFAYSASQTTVMVAVVNIDVGASGGVFSFRWAQNTSNAANTSVLADSSLIVTDFGS